MAPYQSEAARRLYRAILLLENEDECAAFLEDLCTITEIQDMAQRLEAAMLLRRGLNYQTISRRIGISSATISRVSRCIRYGAGGYRTVTQRLADREAEDEL